MNRTENDVLTYIYLRFDTQTPEHERLMVRDRCMNYCDMMGFDVAGVYADITNSKYQPYLDMVKELSSLFGYEVVTLNASTLCDIYEDAVSEAVEIMGMSGIHFVDTNIEMMEDIANGRAR